MGRQPARQQLKAELFHFAQFAGLDFGRKTRSQGRIDRTGRTDSRYPIARQTALLPGRLACHKNGTLQRLEQNQARDGNLDSTGVRQLLASGKLSAF